MADMHENDMVSEDEDVVVDFFKMAQLSAEDKGTPTLHAFNENEYEGEWLLIVGFLRTMTMNASWTKEKALRIWNKAY